MTAKQGADYVEDMAASMLASTLGIRFDPETGYDERKEIYRMSGKIVRTKGGKSHFRRRRSARSKRQFTKMIPVEGSGYQKRIRRLVPYINKYKANPTARTTK